ncbi:MAG: ABC transporter permease subunit [Sutterella parvirubra]|nr:ABC transporter permease subunit [Sutterella parvirubra]
MMLRLDDRSSPWSNFLRRFTKDRVGMISLIVVALLILTAVVGPWVVPYDPENFFDYDHLNEGPSAMYWFGVDSLGGDVFSRIIAGTRLSLMTGLGSVFAGAVIGTVLGLLAGYYEGWTDRIVMRISDVLFAFPGILLAIGIVAILGGGLLNVVMAVAIFSVPAFARLVRGNVLVLKHETYVEAARSIGAGDAVIIFRHILPGTISVILVYLSMRIGSAIITASSLSFLGLGAQPPSPEWGAILNEAREDILTAPHAALFAVGAIFITVLAFNILGDALRDALDPKMRRD